MNEIETIALAPVDALSITTLVDNVTDILLLDEGPARRPPLGSGPRVAAPVLEGGRGLDALRAEHGFSALVTISRDGRQQRVLFDTGISPDGLVENMRRLDRRRDRRDRRSSARLRAAVIALPWRPYAMRALRSPPRWESRISGGSS